MGIGGGSGIGGGAQPPGIRESETTAFNEGTKKNVMAMLPADSLEVIPFTQRAYDETFKYRSEGGKPSLHPLLSLRSSSARQEPPQETWEPAYQELVNSLPPDVKEQLEQQLQLPLSQRDPDFSELNALLILMAKGFEGVDAALQPPAANSSDEINFLQNVALPYVALNAVVNQSQNILTDAQAQLASLGPNDPHFDTMTNYVAQLNQDVSDMNNQMQILAKGGDPSAVKQAMLNISSDLSRLGALFQNTASGGEFKIIGQTLQMMSVVSSAWSLEYGSPSLLISLSLALTGISSADSSLGILGGASNTLLDSALDGMLASSPTGAGAQLAEMEDLYNSLAQLGST